MFNSFFTLGIGISLLINPLRVKSEELSNRFCEQSIRKELNKLTSEKQNFRKYYLSKTEVIDINNDQKKEILIERSLGGNCCPPKLEIVYFTSKCYPRKYEFSKYAWVWGGWEVVDFKKTNEGQILIADNRLEGFDNKKLEVNTVNYFFDGESFNFHSKIIKKEIDAISEIRTSDLKIDTTDEKQTFLVYDINNDQKKEIISCNYWDRWGRFTNCSIKVQDLDEDIKMNFYPKRLGILKEIRNGWNILVLDHDEKYFYNPLTNNYDKNQSHK